MRNHTIKNYTKYLRAYLNVLGLSEHEPDDADGYVETVGYKFPESIEVDGNTLTISYDYKTNHFEEKVEFQDDGRWKVSTNKSGLVGEGDNWDEFLDFVTIDHPELDEYLSNVEEYDIAPLRDEEETPIPKRLTPDQIKVFKMLPKNGMIKLINQLSLEGNSFDRYKFKIMIGLEKGSTEPIYKYYWGSNHQQQRYMNRQAQETLENYLKNNYRIYAFYSLADRQALVDLFYQMYHSYNTGKYKIRKSLTPEERREYVRTQNYRNWYEDPNLDMHLK